MKGYRTYIVATIGVLAAAAGYAVGDLTLLDAINAGMTALGLSTLRAGLHRGVR
jgi:hypothetical protein